MGAGPEPGRVDPVHPEADRRRDRADHEGAGVGHLDDARRGRAPRRAAGPRVGHGRPRGRRRRTAGLEPAPTRGALPFARRVPDWHTVADEAEAFYLRIAGAGQYRYPGADLGILVTRGRFMDDG